MGVARRLAEWTQPQSLNTPFKLSPHSVSANPHNGSPKRDDASTS